MILCSTPNNPQFHSTRDRLGKAMAEVAFALENGMQLQIVTRKAMQGGIYAQATVLKLDGNFTTHRVFHDFSRCLKRTTQSCTVKNIDAMMAEVLQQVPALLTEVKDHYIIKKEWFQAETAPA